WAFLTGPAHAKMVASAQNRDNHFESVIYATQDGLYALKAAIEKMGVDNFRRLDRERLRALAYEITDAHSLTAAQAEALQTYYATGQTSPAAHALVTR